MMLLVALDIEGCAHEVLAVAGQLALELGCGLHLLTALKAPLGVPEEVMLPGAPRNVHDELERAGLDALEELGTSWSAQGVPTRCQVRFGTPEEVVLAAVQEVQPRFLVLGTHARTGLSRLVYGSVEESIVRHVRVPVIVVPAPGDPVHPSKVLSALRAESDG